MLDLRKKMADFSQLILNLGHKLWNSWKISVYPSEISRRKKQKYSMTASQNFSTFYLQHKAAFIFNTDNSIRPTYSNAIPIYSNVISVP